MSHSPKAVIIGAGVAGIATAIRLAAQGMHVDVYEKNAYAGGKMHAFEAKGYHFDAGPSLFTQPENIAELFRLSGENMEDHFHYRRMENTCNYFYFAKPQIQFLHPEYYLCQ